MASTASGWQYAVPNDTLVAWPAVSQAVADKLEISLPKSAGVQLVKTQTIGNGVSSVNVTAAFNSTYPNYLIHIAGMDASQENGGGALRFGTTSSPVTTNYSYSGTYVPYTGSPGWIQQANPGFWEILGTDADINSQGFTIYGPNIAGATTYQSNFARGEATINVAGIHNAATQHTDFHIYATVGTLTGGTIYVYGFAKV